AAMPPRPMTVTATSPVPRVAFPPPGLESPYTGATRQFAFAGAAALSITGIANVSVAFGHTAGGSVTPGLVVTSGTLQSLDMTVNGSFTVASVAITDTDLQLTYAAANQHFNMACAAALSIAGIASLRLVFEPLAGGS